MFRVPRGWVPGYGWGVADYRSLTRGGDKAEYLTHVASPSQDWVYPSVARSWLEGVGGLEAGLAAHPREYDSYRLSVP